MEECLLLFPACWLFKRDPIPPGSVGQEEFTLVFFSLFFFTILVECFFGSHITAVPPTLWTRSTMAETNALFECTLPQASDAFSTLQTTCYYMRARIDQMGGTSL